MKRTYSIHDLLNTASDAKGQCDRCHEDHKELWEDIEGDNQKMFCETCWREIARAAGQ